MPAGTFQYWDGAAWQTDSQYIRCTIVDELGLPMRLEVTVANHSGTGIRNNRENFYSDYQQVRFTEGNTSRILLYGKIEKTDPKWDDEYGQILTVYARDNLQELHKRLINERFTGVTVRSALISSIITSYSYSTNIGVADTTKFLTSPVSFASTAFDYTNSGVSALKAIAELADTDLVDSTPTGIAHDYYLDAEFSGSTPTPDLHYFPRGSRPAGGGQTHGLECGIYAGDGTKTRSIQPDYNFPRPHVEMVTRVRIEYVDVSNVNQQLYAILVNHGAVTAGPFVVGNTVTWPAGGSARIEAVGSTFLVVGPTTVGSTVYLTTVSGLLLTSGGTTATANASSTNPPGTLREAIAQDVEKVIRGYNIETLAEARAKAEEILHHGGDIVIRGSFKILQWPYVTWTGTHTGANNAAILTSATGAFTSKDIYPGDIVQNTTDGSEATITAITATTITGALSGGTDNDWDTGDAYRIRTLIRTGQEIYVSLLPGGTGITDQDMLVTKITYDEGPGIQMSEIEVMATARGKRAEVPVVRAIVDDIETSLWQTPATIGGGLPTGWQPFVTNLQIRGTAYNAISWDNGTGSTDATITFADGSSRTIDFGTAVGLTASTTYWLYIDTSVVGDLVLQNTTTYSNAIGDSIVLLALVLIGADATSGDEPTILPFNSKEPTIAATALVANSITSTQIRADSIIAGDLRIGAGRRWILDTTAFTPYDESISGTATVTAGTAAVAGTGTSFFTQLTTADFIRLGNEVHGISSIAVDGLSLTLLTNHIEGASGVTPFRTNRQQHVRWTAGTIRFANGDSDAVTAGNTSRTGLNLTAASTKYVYYDEVIGAAGDITATTTLSTALGNGRVLLAIATPTTDAVGSGALNSEHINIEVMSGGQTLINSSGITTNAITADRIRVGAGGNWNSSIIFSPRTGGGNNAQQDVEWTAGTLETAQGITYSIVSGNTATLSTVDKYIYLDNTVSTTILQSTTTLANAIGNNRILIAIADPTAETGANADQIAITVMNGASTLINSSGITTNSIRAAEIQADAITSVKIIANAITAAKLEATLILATSIIAGTAANGWTMSASGLIGYLASVEQVRLNTSGRIVTGSGTSIVLDDAGMQVVGSLGTPITFRSAIDGAINGALQRNAGTNEIILDASTAGWDLSLESLTDVNIRAPTAGRNVVIDVSATGALVPVTDVNIDLGTAALRFDNTFVNRVFVGTRNSIGDSGTGNMAFRVDNAGAEVLAMQITTGAANVRALSLESTRLIGVRTLTTAPAIGDLSVGEIVIGEVAPGTGATDGRIWVKPDAGGVAEIYEFQSVARIT